MRRALISLFFLLVAIGAAFAVAWGTEPSLAQKPGGMQWIMLARRFQWPLTALSLFACFAMIALVVSGSRRAWWLLALAPVLFLFYQRFAGASWRQMTIAENPLFVRAADAAFLKGDSPVMGAVIDDVAYAYPLGCLYSSPVVLHTQADQRVLVMYSPYAGRAHAAVVDHSIKARELDIVSMPANAMLLYNSRIGQFINAFTGQTPTGEKPAGFGASIDLAKYTWQQWRTLHPETRVLAVSYRIAGEKVVPVFPCAPPAGGLPPDTRVTLLATAKPLAVRIERMMSRKDEVLNLSAGGSNLLIFRDKSRLRVFDRTVKGDLFPRFQRKSIAKKPEVAFIDLDTNSLWSADLHCLEGYAKGERLRVIKFDEDLPWGTVAVSYPGIELLGTR